MPSPPAIRLTEALKGLGAKNLSPETVDKILEPEMAGLRKKVEALCSSMVALSKSEGDLRLRLGDDVVAVVNFSGPITKGII